MSKIREMVLLLVVRFIKQVPVILWRSICKRRDKRKLIYSMKNIPFHIFFDKWRDDRNYFKKHILSRFRQILITNID